MKTKQVEEHTDYAEQFIQEFREWVKTLEAGYLSAAVYYIGNAKKYKIEKLRYSFELYKDFYSGDVNDIVTGQEFIDELVAYADTSTRGAEKMRFLYVGKKQRFGFDAVCRVIHTAKAELNVK